MCKAICKSFEMIEIFFKFWRFFKVLYGNKFSNFKCRFLNSYFLQMGLLCEWGQYITKAFNINLTCTLPLERRKNKTTFNFASFTG